MNFKQFVELVAKLSTPGELREEGATAENVVVDSMASLGLLIDTARELMRKPTIH